MTRPAIARGLERPTHPGDGPSHMGFVWPCSGWGLPCLRCRHRSGELLPRHFTLALAGGMFSVALSPGRPESPLATILPCGVRTFLSRPFPRRESNRLARSGRNRPFRLASFIQVGGETVNHAPRLAAARSGAEPNHSSSVGTTGGFSPTPAVILMPYCSSFV